MTAVFVYADGRVGLEDTPFAHLPSIKFPIPQRLKWDRETALDMTPPTFPCVEFFRRGMNYQGIPIFCVNGYEVKEVAMLVKHVDTTDEATKIKDHLQRQVRKFVDDTYPSYRELGERIESREVTPEMKAQNLAETGIRLLIAAWVA